MASPTSAFPPGYAEEDISARVIAVGVTFIVLEIAIAALRFTARAVCKTKWGLDDYLIIPALVFSLGMCTIAIIEAKIAGIGRHLDVLLVTNPQAVVNWAKCGYAIEQLYCAAVAFPKLSILASYLRIFTTRPYRIITYTVAGIVMATAIAGIITSLASCHPFSSRWDLKLFISNCIDAVRYWKGMSVPNIATDVVMLILPMPVVWRLQVSKNQKLALSGIFLMGSLGIVASIVRLTVTFRVTALSDGTWDSADIATWSLVESGCYLIAACLPVLRPLFVRATRRLAGTARSQTRHSTGSSISMREQKSSPGESQSLYDAPLQPNTTRFIFNANSSSETNHILASGRNSSGTSASGNLHDMQHEYYSRHGIGTAV